MVIFHSYVKLPEGNQPDIGVFGNVEKTPRTSSGTANFSWEKIDDEPVQGSPWG